MKLRIFDIFYFNLYLRSKSKNYLSPQTVAICGLSFCQAIYLKTIIRIIWIYIIKLKYDFIYDMAVFVVVLILNILHFNTNGAKIIKERPAYARDYWLSKYLTYVFIYSALFVLIGFELSMYW